MVIPVAPAEAARTLRTLTPIGYFGSIVSHPFPLALIAALCGGAHAIELAALALICRLTLCFCIAYTFRLPRQAYGLIPLLDVLAFAVFVTSFFGRAVSWRGYRGRVLSDGTLVPTKVARPPDAGLTAALVARRATIAEPLRDDAQATACGAMEVSLVVKIGRAHV